MAYSDLIDARRSWAWLLTISGVTVRYYSGQAPPTTAVPGVAGVNYVDVEAIAPDGIGSQRMRLDEMGGVSDVGGLSVTLVSRAGMASSTDPVRVLGRVSRQGATAWTKLAETIQHDTAGLASVQVTDSLAAWPSSGGIYFFHVGQEMFRATGVAAGPPRFTGVTRAVARTRPQEHLYDLGGVGRPGRGYQPVVTSEAVSWRTRRVSLQVAPITGRALTAADYVEVIAGYIDQTPKLARDGLSVDVDIAPLTMALKQTVGGETASTQLVTGWHRFEPGVADTFGVALIAREGLVLAENTQGPAAPDTIGCVTDMHQAMADVTLAPGQPRRLPVKIQGVGSATYEPTGYVAGVPPRLQLAVGALPAGIGANSRVINAESWDVRTYKPTAAGSAVLVQWPIEVLADLAGPTVWAPGVVTGADGLWADVVPYMRSDGSPAVRMKINGDVPGSRIDVNFRAAWSRSARVDFFPGQGFIRPTSEMAHYGLQWCEPGDDRWFDPRPRGGLGESGRNERDNLRGVWERNIDLASRRNVGDAIKEVDIRGWALGYYQTGEPSVLATGLVLPTAPAGTQWLHARWTEGGEQLTQFVPVQSVGTQTDGAGNLIGYLYSIPARWRYRIRSFGQWSDSERVELRAAAAWERASSSDVVLQLLLSGRGRGVNSGTYDVLPFGANLDAGEVRTSDFDLRSTMGLIDEWTTALVDSTTVEKVIEPMLRACGVALSVRRYPTALAGYQQALTVVPVGVETPEVVARITSADILLDGRPASETEDKPTARYKVSADYDLATGEPRTVATYVDSDAIAENGGDGGALVEIELRGLHLDNPADIITGALPVIDSIRARLGRPRRKYRLTLHAGWGLRLALGDVVDLTAPDAIDYDGTRGVTAARCRVTGLTVDWSGGTCEVELTSYGARTAGWAPAMRISAVVDATTLTVEPNDFTDIEDPLTRAALQDSDYFAAADVVSIVPPGNWAGRLSRTLGSVNGATVTLTVALPGPLPQYVGQTIRPAAYDSTSARLRVYVYGADSARTLGAAADPGRDWA